jgi:thiol-disulfide isomerase/thioredoxin
MFTTETCEPCKQIKPAIQELQEDFPLVWYYIDLKENPEIAKKYGVEKVPTMVVESPKGIFKHSGTDISGYYKLLINHK